MNIVVLAKKDFGGSAWQMVQAIRKTTDHRIHLVTEVRNEAGDGCDFCVRDHEKDLPQPEMRRSVQEVIAERKSIINKVTAKLGKVQHLINEADIIHWKGDHLPADKFSRYLRVPQKKTIISVGGSGFRRRGKARHKYAQLAWFSIDEYVRRADICTAFTADLNYPELKGTYTQQAIDSCSQPNLWENKARPVIAHSPSHRGKKGTDLFLEACRILQDSRYKFDVDIIENVTKAECIERKKNATIFFDQVGVGFYGNAALEAMQFGIPTIAGIPDFAYDQSSGKLTRETCPVISVEPTVDSIADAIFHLLELSASRYLQLRRISKRTKEFCDGFHSYEAVGNMWDEIYNAK